MAGMLSHRTSKSICAVAGLFCLLTLCRSAASQLPTATILGVAKDATGALITGVTLTAKNTGTGMTRTTVTAADGSYRFSALSVGTYEVRAENPGFQTEERSGLTLTIDEQAVVNFTLQVGAVQQTVSVTAEAPLVNTTTGELGGLVDEHKVADLPLNGRNYIDLTLLQTGVVQHKNLSVSASTVGTWFSSNGAGVRSNNYMLDGAIMTNSTGATSASSDGSTLGIEGLREYRVITNSASAEYGMTMGAQVVLVSKGGTNEFHGDVFDYLRNSALDARNFFDYQSVATPPGFRLPEYRRNQFGATFGGPIKRDKTFFFAVYEGLRDATGITTIDNVPAASAHINGATPGVAQIAPVIQPLLALFPLPNLPKNQYTFPFTQPTREDYGQIRVDQSISSKDSFFARETVDNTGQVNPLAYPTPFDQIRASQSQFATVSENHIFSSNLLNTARFSFSRTDPTVQSNTYLIGPQYSYLPGGPMGSLAIAGITGLGPASTSIQRRNVFTWSNDSFYTRGRHSFKFGTLINHFQDYSYVGTQALGSVSFGTLQSFLLGQPSTYSANTPGSIVNRTYHYGTFGFYVQDDLRLFPNLTLNLGLRYEFMTVPNDVYGINSALQDVQHDAAAIVGPIFKNPGLHNFGPRLGFAWDVFGDGKTAVRGGFAELYDLANLGGALSVGLTGTPPFATVSSVTNSTTNPAVLTLPLSFPPNSLGKSLRLLDYDLHQSHLLTYNLGVERQLPGRMALTVAYAGSRGINVLQTVDGNPVVPQILPGGQIFFPVGAPRTNQNWSYMEYKTAGGNSWYNSLQLGLSKQFSHGVQFQSSYSWSKLLDETQGQQGTEANTSSIFPVYTGNIAIDKAPANFDLTQVYHFNLIYQLPSPFAPDEALGRIFNGWQASGILSLQTGYPFSPVESTNISRSGTDGGAAGIDRPNLNTGSNNSNIVSGTSVGCQTVPAGTPLGTPTLYYDPCAFTQQAAGFLGNAGRNILRGPGLANLDFSLMKDASIKRLGESGKLEFRADFFNIFNRANFAMPNNTVFAGAALNSTAGGITSTATKSRQIQLALKILF